MVWQEYKVRECSGGVDHKVRECWGGLAGVQGERVFGWCGS